MTVARRRHRRRRLGRAGRAPPASALAGAPTWSSAAPASSTCCRRLPRARGRVAVAAAARAAGPARRARGPRLRRAGQRRPDVPRHRRHAGRLLGARARPCCRTRRRCRWPAPAWAGRRSDVEVRQPVGGRSRCCPAGSAPAGGSWCSARRRTAADVARPCSPARVRREPVTVLDRSAGRRRRVTAPPRPGCDPPATRSTSSPWSAGPPGGPLPPRARPARRRVRERRPAHQARGPRGHAVAARPGARRSCSGTSAPARAASRSSGCAPTRPAGRSPSKRDAERAARIARNAAALGVPGCAVVDGAAPGRARRARRAGRGVHRRRGDRARRGRGLLGRAAPGGRLVVNAVTSSPRRARRLVRRLGGDLTRIAVHRAAPVGGFTGWRPLMPVTQLGVTKP